MKIEIDGNIYFGEENETILDVAKRNNIYIPTLCFLRNINEIGACRVCAVEIEGKNNLYPACVYKIYDGMKVKTNTPRVIFYRKQMLENLLKTHNNNCLSCDRSLNCELQKLCNIYDTEALNFNKPQKNQIDDSVVGLYRDNSKCINCKRCISVCDKIQSVNALEMRGSGENKYIWSVGKNLKDSPCVECGQCLINCPTGAILDKSDKDEVLYHLANKQKRMIVATAPSVRVALGECFNGKIGENVEGKMVAALRKLGFDDVFDIDFGADVTVIEEAKELMDRLKSGANLPLFTSCCPAWVSFVETFYPSLIKNISTCKSPQQILASLVKTYYAKKLDVLPSELYFVSVVPCTAKKEERLRVKNQNFAPDTDAVLTTRDLAQLIKMAGIDFNNLEDEKFDDTFGLSSGSGVIFGATGGIMEAVLRTSIDKMKGKTVEKVEYQLVRGKSGIREAEVKINDRTLKIAVVSGLGNARDLLEDLMQNKTYYDFVEVMACPGGCTGGGGMPINSLDKEFLSRERAKNLFKTDLLSKLKKSHENPAVKKVYSEFLGEVGGEKAKKILHTTFSDKSKKIKKQD